MFLQAYGIPAWASAPRRVPNAVLPPLLWPNVLAGLAAVLLLLNAVRAPIEQAAGSRPAARDAAGAGCLVMQYRVTAASFLIAFIPGPLLDGNFRQAMQMPGFNPTILSRRPITWFFRGLTLITALAILRSTVKAAKAGATA